MKQAIILFIGFVLACQYGIAQPAKGSMLIKNGTVLTVTKGTIENADILIQNGIIKAVGQNIKTPSGITTIDATGKYVMPGIIDAHSHLALDVVNEASNPNTADVWVGDAINPLDIGIYRALAGGVTAAHAMHGSANVIGGECETMKMRYGSYNPEDLRMEGAPRTIKFALGENPMRVHGEGRKVMPGTRMGVEQVFRQAFEEAKAYKAAKQKYATEKVKNPAAVPPPYSRRLETVAGILDGDVLIHCHSYRADEIVMLMNVCKDYGVEKICFQHVNEGFKIAPELAKFGAYTSVFADWWAYKFEVYYSTAYNAAILHRNGVVTSINSDSDDYIRRLFHEAAKTQRYGDLTDDEALAMITINPAIQLGVGDRIGSIEVGKEADIAIFEGHPLSIYAIPQMTIIEGKVYFDINKDPKDMRLEIDPEKTDSEFELHHAHDHEHDRCMEGVNMNEK